MSLLPLLMLILQHQILVRHSTQLLDNVTSNAPNDYYDNLDGLAGNALIQGMQDLIAENGVGTNTYLCRYSGYIERS